MNHHCQNLKKKILIIGLIESIHLARWINQIKDERRFEIFIFPSKPNYNFHPDLLGINLFIPLRGLFFIFNLIGLKSYKSQLYSLFFTQINKSFPRFYQKQLENYFSKINPDLVHTLETQNAGYLFGSLRNKSLKFKSVVWWHTNYGSDIQLFGQLKEHKEKIKLVLTQADYYSCECNRDIDLAKKWGFVGEFLPVYPNAGGFNLDEITSIRSQSEQTSKRKCIMVKGYQGWAGRALVAIKALELCKDVLKDFKIVFYSVNVNAIDIQIALNLLSNNSNLDIEIITTQLSHHKILELHSKARISIGMSIGDGISTSLLEAMSMGAFPIQSNTSCASEWIDNDISGILTDAEVPGEIADAIVKALTNDSLVDNANKLNIKVISEKVNFEKLKILTLKSYNRILKFN